jgi:hypothetical protein
VELPQFQDKYQLMLNVMFCMPVMLIFYHVFCCADELLLMPGNIYVSSNSYTYSEFKCVSLLKCMLFYNPESECYISAKYGKKVVLQFGIRAIKPW